MIPAIRKVRFRIVLIRKIERTLDDGTHINRESQEVVMRDSPGFIYGAPESQTRNISFLTVNGRNR